MFQVSILTCQKHDFGPFCQTIGAEGIVCTAMAPGDDSSNGHLEQPPDAALVDMASLHLEQARQLIADCRQRGIPVITLVPDHAVEAYDYSLNADDILLWPSRPGELALRLKQAILKVKGVLAEKVVHVGELAIDLERYEVTVSGHRVLLTYKEYQLLVLLASNPGRVFSRDRLLSQLWGYDYFGGTRTVDVHIRRLRAKIEEGGHLFIETIRNVGYRFKTA